MKLSFAKKLTLSYLFVVIVTLIFAGLYLSPRLEKGFQSQMEHSRRVAGLQKDLLLTGAFGIALALSVAFLSVRRIIRPLEELMSRMRLVTEAGLGETTSDANEFRQLAGTIDGLASKIAGKVDELGREKSQLAAILDALLEGVIAADHRGRILFLNPAAERMFGVTQKSVEGRPFLEGLRHSTLTDVLMEGLQTHQHLTREITVHTPHERLLRVHARAVDYGNGTTGVLAALHDISDVRRLERIRQEFISNVSHELKTPLTSIKGFVETLLDGALEDPHNNRAFLETINEQANRLMRLIEDILDLSAIEARRVEYRFEAVTLRDIVDRIFAALMPQARAHHIELKLDLPETLPTVRADREKLAQILLNLLENAIKFNRSGGHVTLKARHADGRISLSVTDDGPGIAPEDLPRVFERFYRGDKSHSQVVPGTGLGLAIVKHLVEAHQGTVTVESLPDQGATFRFSLPQA
jgi:two-component system phosphate regulon sensor histidine kinase PhoR